MLSSAVKIIVADDHAVIRQGLRSLIDSVEGWVLVGEAQDGFELIPLVEKLAPDLVVLDLTMPNLGGVEAICRLTRLERYPFILVLSAREDEAAVEEAMNAGARGYIPKSASSDELIFAIKAVLKGQRYISPSVCAGYLDKKQHSQPASALFSLSGREREVMKLLCEGRPNREVAKMLHISPRTVDSHRANIMKKLGVASNAELVQVALKSKLID